MQPKRDPNDRRFWPARLGGTSGFGMQRYGKPSPYRYGAASPQGSLSDNPRPDRVTPDGITEARKPIDAETVKARARLLSVKAMEALEEKASSMDVSSLVDTLNAAGKLSGAIDRGGSSVNFNLGALHLAALQAPRATAKLLPNEVASVTDAVTVDADVDANANDDSELGHS